MKKQKKWLALLLLGVLALTGCGSSAGEPAQADVEGSAEEYVQAAKDALAEADSFTADFTATVSMEGAGKTATTGQIAMVEEPFYMKVDTVTDFDGMEQPYTIYLEESDDAVNQYMNYEGQWTEMTMTAENALLGVKIYDVVENMQTILSAAEGWELNTADGHPQLTAAIPGEKVYSVEESGRLFQLAGMSGLSEIYFEGVEAVPVTVAMDEKTGAPLSYEVDLAKALETVTNNVLKELNGGTLEDGVTVESYSISSQLTQLGEVVAEEIPAAAKDTAINYEKEISLLEKGS